MIIFQHSREDMHLYLMTIVDTITKTLTTFSGVLTFKFDETLLSIQGLKHCSFNILHYLESLCTHYTFSKDGSLLLRYFNEDDDDDLIPFSKGWYTSVDDDFMP